MKKSSTPRLLSEKAIAPILTPKSSTVELLKQFARSYTYESYHLRKNRKYPRKKCPNLTRIKLRQALNLYPVF